MKKKILIAILFLLIVALVCITLLFYIYKVKNFNEIKTNDTYKENDDQLVNFESKDVSKIEQEFHGAVDDYLEFCEEIGKTPDKEYKGTFNVRITPELHKKLALKAYENGESLNATVEKAIQEYLTEG